MKIGIYGGTFDPVHYGHLISADYLISAQEVDKIVFVPTADAYYKESSPFSERIYMLFLAIKKYKKFKISNIEHIKKCKGRAYLMLKEIEKKCNDELYYIMGSDAVFDIESWYNCEKLLREFKFLVLKRPGYSFDEIDRQVIYLNEKYNAFIKLINTPQIEISSTYIRENLKNKKSIDFLLPERLVKYLEEKYDRH